jgi:hypothetical protein
VLLPEWGFADSLILKDGSEVKGDIIQNDSNGVLIEYYVTATIKDQKTIPRDQIEKIISIQPDDKAFLDLGSCATPPTVLDTTFYDALIDKKIPDFLEHYGYSKHVSELRDDLRSLNAERARIVAGDRRINGVWITAQQIAADPYEMGAKIRLNELKLLSSGDDPVVALKSYEQLEKNYPGSSVMPDALDLVPKLLVALQGKISAAKQDYEIMASKRQAWISSASTDQSRDFKLALERENQAALAAIASAQKDGSKFFPIFPNCKDALDQLQTLLLAEKARLAGLQSSAMRASLEASNNASKSLEAGSLGEVQAKLTTAAQLWPANAAVASLKLKLDAAMAKKTALPATTSSAPR